MNMNHVPYTMLAINKALVTNNIGVIGQIELKSIF